MRVDGGLVGGLLVAQPDEPGGGERRRLGDAHQLEREVAVGALLLALGRLARGAHRVRAACA